MWWGTTLPPSNLRKHVSKQEVDSCTRVSGEIRGRLAHSLPPCTGGGAGAVAAGVQCCCGFGVATQLRDGAALVPAAAGGYADGA